MIEWWYLFLFCPKVEFTPNTCSWHVSDFNLTRHPWRSAWLIAGPHCPRKITNDFNANRASGPPNTSTWQTITVSIQSRRVRITGEERLTSHGRITITHLWIPALIPATCKSKLVVPHAMWIWVDGHGTTFGAEIGKSRIRVVPIRYFNFVDKSRIVIWIWGANLSFLYELLEWFQDFYVSFASRIGPTYSNPKCSIKALNPLLTFLKFLL